MNLLAWFNVLTNLFIIYPTVLGFQYQKPIEGMIWFMTGLSSFTYHLTDTEIIEVPDSIYTSFRHVDYLFSDLTVMSILFLLFIPHTKLRQISYIGTIPFFIILIELKYPIYIHWIPILVSFAIASAFYEVNLKMNCYEKYECLKKSVLYIGLFMSMFQFIFYYYLPLVSPSLYDFYHGIHHMLGFLSIVVYFKTIQFRKRQFTQTAEKDEETPSSVIDISNSSLNIGQRVNLHPARIHRRNFSMS